jgi:hypothetical protein
MAEDFVAEDFVAEDFVAEDLPAGDLEFDLRRADVEREVIVLETWVQREPRWVRSKGGTSRFKRALIGMSQSAPIRDR